MDYRNETHRSTIVPGETRGVANGDNFLKRISWGAVFAGFLLAAVVNLTLNLLGIGIGLGSLDPTGQNVAEGLGIGSIIWYVVSTILSLLAGGWVAAHLAGVPNSKDSALHGILSWCLFTIFSFYLLTTAVGKILSVTGSVVGQTFSLVGQGVGAVAPELADAAQQQLQQADISVQNIKSEAKEILRQTDQAALQPGNIADEAQEAGQQVKNTADNPAQLDEVIQQVFSKGGSVISNVDKEAIVNVLVARTDQSQTEAQNTVDNWATQYEQAQQKFSEMKQQAATQARQTAENVSAAISKAAIAGFFALIIGAISGGVGGILGKPKAEVREAEYA
ncbi:hypothetical protein WJR50_30955 [Catalinimonas sp. 4WD22]|uniref:hypothetical protein n=1 Tax=Catalinimonas locisalis TaxID=3133978 RepID=UPI003101AD6B